MGESLGVAVLGAGLYGRVHARAYSTCPGCDLRWVWSRGRERAEEIAGRYGARATTDLADIASDPGVAAVSVATPDFAHAQPALAMLRAGKHVLVEKPMATTTAECQAMMASAERAGVQLMVNFHNRWYPPFAEARRLLGEGRIGRPLAGIIRLSDRIEVATRWLPWAGQSGPEWFLFPHTVDLACWLLGCAPVRVFATGQRGVLEGQGVPCYDVVQAQLIFDSAVITLESSWLLPASWPNIIEFGLDLHGAAGKLSVTGDRENLTVAAERFEQPFTLNWLTEDEPVQEFARCLLEGRPVPVTGEDGLRTTAVLEAIRRSLASGQVEAVEASNS